MSRINYKTVLAKYRALGKGDVRLTQSALFLTKPITSTSTTYQFDILENQNATLQNDEIRLNLNDEFIVTQMGFYLVGKSATLGITDQIKLFTYAPTEVRSGNLHLQNAYAGQLQISVNNIVYLDKWDTRKHEIVPQTQYGNAGAAAAAFQLINGTQASSNFSKDGMANVEPMLTLSGAKKNQITLSIPTPIQNGAVTVTDEEGGDPTVYTINRVGILLRGLNAQNGASFQR